jgi:uncharacterized repeat protein (TIGR02543 family)
MMKYTDFYYFSDREVVLEGFEVPLVAYATDVSYAAGAGLFYFADPGHTIYAMDMEGNLTSVDILGNGIDMYGFAIDPTAKFQITYTDGVEGTELFRDQFYFAAEGAQTPSFIGTPTREGYTFAGWTPAIEETVSGHTVYEATWTPNTYKLTFDVSGGELDNRTMEVTFGAPIGELPVPTRTGYTFVGWIDREGNMYTADTIYSVAGDTFLIAVWNVNSYTITLDPNGGELSVQGLIVEYGALVNLPVPTREGFEFLGWFDAEGNEYTAETVYTVDGDITLTARWSETNPETGDNAIRYAMMLSLLAACSLAVLVIKRKQIQ